MLSKIIRFFKEPLRPYGNLNQVGYVVPVPFMGSVNTEIFADEIGDSWVLLVAQKPILLKHYLKDCVGKVACVSADEFLVAKREWLESFSTPIESAEPNEFYDAVLRKDKKYLNTALTSSSIVVYPDDTIDGLSVYMAKVGNYFYTWEAPTSDFLIQALDRVIQHHLKEIKL